MRRSTFVALVVGVLAGLGVQLALAQPIDPVNGKFRNITVTGTESANRINATFVDAGTLTVSGTAKIAALDAGVANIQGQLTVSGAFIGASRVSAGTGSIVGAGGSTFIQTYPGFANLLSINESTLAVTTYGKVTLSSNSATCALNGGSPATCTATVTANARCVANTIGTTAAAAKALAVSLSSTTLTITAANGSTETVNIFCDR